MLQRVCDISLLSLRRPGVVDTIAELIEDHKITSPALLVFGNVVSVHPAFARIRDFYHTLSEA